MPRSGVRSPFAPPICSNNFSVQIQSIACSPDAISCIAKKQGAIMQENKKSKPSLRTRAAKIKDFRCKNLIAVIEDPDEIRNVATVIRNINALGVEKAYVVTDGKILPDTWEEMRHRRKLSAISASAIK